MYIFAAIAIGLGIFWVMSAIAWSRVRRTEILNPVTPQVHRASAESTYRVVETYRGIAGRVWWVVRSEAGGGTDITHYATKAEAEAAVYGAEQFKIEPETRGFEVSRHLPARVEQEAGHLELAYR